jgi:hypothetical protein
VLADKHANSLTVGGATESVSNSDADTFLAADNRSDTSFGTGFY